MANPVRRLILKDLVVLYASEVDNAVNLGEERHANEHVEEEHVYDDAKK
jgi:hypothetical protein